MRTSTRGLLILLSSSMVLFLAEVVLAAPPDAPGSEPSPLLDRRGPEHPFAFGAPPLTFEANRGQTDAAVRFLCRRPGYTLLLTPSAAVLVLERRRPVAPQAGRGPLAFAGGAAVRIETAVLRMTFPGANPAPALKGQQLRRGRSNYLLGNDPAGWIRDVPHYGKAVYENIYPDVDLVFYDGKGRPEFDFVLAPGADPRDIRLGFEGAEALAVDPDGRLLIRGSGLELELGKPVSYQQVDGERRAVAGRYEIQAGDIVGFDIDEYDPRERLFIDPQILYGTHLGVTGWGSVPALAVDDAGAIYVAGANSWYNFPTKNAIEDTYPFGTFLNNYAYVTKLLPRGEGEVDLVYSTFFGGTSGHSSSLGVAVDTGGQASVCGWSSQFNFPLVNAPGDPQGPIPTRDAFVCRLVPEGNDFVYSVLIGGSDQDSAQGLALDPFGAVYLIGETNSTDLPVVNPIAGFGESNQGSVDILVAKLAPFWGTPGESVELVYLSYLGGSETDYVSKSAIALDGAGDTYITGTTYSVDFPFQTRSEPYNPPTAFVVKLDNPDPGEPDSPQIDYSTFLTDRPGSFGYDIALKQGCAYIAGRAWRDLPQRNPLSANGIGQIFVSKLNPSGTDLLFSSYVREQRTNEVAGDSSQAVAMTLDEAGRIYILGYSDTALPVRDPIRPFSGSPWGDVFLTRIDPDSSEILLSTFLAPIPGSGFPAGEVVLKDGKAFIAGSVVSDFPTTPGAFDEDGMDEEFDQFVGAGYIAVIDVLPDLVRLGDPATVTLHAHDSWRFLRLALPGGETVLPAGRTILVTARAADAGDTLAIYGRWGSEPSRLAFDEVASGRGRSEQRLVLAYTRTDTCFLRVEASRIRGDSSEITVEAQLVDLALTTMSTRRAATGGIFTASIPGGLFDATTRFSLLPSGGGDPIEAADTLIVSPGRADVLFDLRDVAGIERRDKNDAPTGTYDLVAENGDGDTAALTGALTVTESTLCPGLTVRIHAPETYRANYPARLLVEYRNEGDCEILAPILKVEGPPGSFLRLESHEAFQENESLLFLGVDLDGQASTLPPGAGGQASIVFTMDVPPGIPPDAAGRVPVTFQVKSFTPTRSDFVLWDTRDRPQALTQKEWNDLLPRLSLLGATWKEVHESIAAQATRVSHRGLEPSDFQVVAAHAVAVVLDDPDRVAIVGQLRDAGGATLPGTSIGARGGGTLVSKTVTDAAGQFTLTCLGPGSAYELAVEGYSLPDPERTLPEDGRDLLGQWLFVSPEDNGQLGEPTAGPCVATDRGRHLLPLPDYLFTPLAGRVVIVGSSRDPNEKVGPEGDGPPLRAIDAKEVLYYNVHFQNQEAASDPAQIVRVRDRISELYDRSSFQAIAASVSEPVWDEDEQLLKTGEGFRTVALGPVSEYRARGAIRDLVPSSPWPDVEVTLRYDPTTGVAEWTLEQVDMETGGTPPYSTLEGGFLPPGARGQLSFLVSLPRSIAEGTDVKNEATITFDAENPIRTNLFTNRVACSEIIWDRHGLFDQFPSPRHTLERSVEPDDLSLSWTELPRAVTYDVTIWEDGRDEPLETVSAIESTIYTPEAFLEAGKTYRWQIRARDCNGQELVGPEWTFRSVTLAPAPRAPGNLEPASGSTNIPLRPTLRWEASADAAAYTIFLWPAGEVEPAEPVFNGMAATEYTLPEGMLERGREYRWRVVALNRTGTGQAEASFWTEGPLLRRGDVDGSGTVDITDPINNLAYQFLGTFEPRCLDALDTNDSGFVDITDPIHNLTYQFTGGVEIPLPGPGSCGLDPTADSPEELGCEDYKRCE